MNPGATDFDVLNAPEARAMASIDTTTPPAPTLTQVGRSELDITHTRRVGLAKSNVTLMKRSFFEDMDPHSDYL